MTGWTTKALALAAVLALVPTALAHHPGDRLDEVMGSKERYFEATDRPAPPFELVDAEGNRVALQDLADKVVVLNFIYASCPDVCPLHAEKMAEVQAMVNETPMKEQVRFVSVTTDPESDTREVMKAYGPAHGLDPANWTFLTTRPEQPEAATRALAHAFGHTFTETEDGYQAHGVVTHVIDRGGRWAGNFHGLRFAPLNLVLYLNGLVNASSLPEQQADPGLWDRVKELFQ